MEKEAEATIKEVRERVDAIPKTVRLTTKSGSWEIKVDGSKLQSLDRFLLLSASRVSEALTTQRPCESSKLLNTGLSLSLSLDEFEGEEVAVFNLKTLKRHDHIVRSIALPLSPEFEPWTKHLVEDWSRGNPWDLARQHAWAANRIVFAGLLYKVGEDFKPLANHGMRHIRIKELIQHYGFSPLEVQRFVGWKSQTIGVNPMMDIYFSLVWRDYFPNLLKKYSNN